MRVIVFVKATADSEAGVLPTTELMEAMAGTTRSFSMPES